MYNPFKPKPQINEIHQLTNDLDHMVRMRDVLLSQMPKNQKDSDQKNTEVERHNTNIECLQLVITHLLNRSK